MEHQPLHRDLPPCRVAGIPCQNAFYQLHLLVPLFCLVMELCQDILQLFRDGQPQVSGILQKAHTLVGDVEKDNRRPQDTPRSDDLHIEDVGDPHKQEDQHLLCNAPESYLTGQLLIRRGAHHARDIVHHDKGDQCIQQAVTAAEEIAEPPSGGRKDELDRVPEFLHSETLL